MGVAYSRRIHCDDEVVATARLAVWRWWAVEKVFLIVIRHRTLLMIR